MVTGEFPSHNYIAQYGLYEKQDYAHKDKKFGLFVNISQQSLSTAEYLPATQHIAIFLLNRHKELLQSSNRHTCAACSYLIYTCVDMTDYRLLLILILCAPKLCKINPPIRSSAEYVTYSLKIERSFLW